MHLVFIINKIVKTIKLTFENKIWKEETDYTSDFEISDVIKFEILNFVILNLFVIKFEE